jgi:hypothetical protein
LPTLGELTPEGKSEFLSRKYGLFEASTNVNILNRKGILEFNFEYDKLYSYYYILKDLDSVEAGELYANLRECYTFHFGQYDESVASDPAGFRAESSFWVLDEFRVGLTNNIYASGCVLSWGYQIRRP